MHLTSSRLKNSDLDLLAREQYELAVGEKMFDNAQPATMNGSNSVRVRKSFGGRSVTKRLRIRAIPGHAELFRLHFVKGPVCGIQQRPDGVGIARVSGHSDADGKLGRLAIFRQKFADAVSHQCGRGCAGFRKDQREFVATVTCRGVYRAAAVGHDLCEAAECAATHQMAMLIVNLL